MVAGVSIGDAIVDSDGGFGLQNSGLGHSVGEEVMVLLVWWLQGCRGMQ